MSIPPYISIQTRQKARKFGKICMAHDFRNDVALSQNVTVKSMVGSADLRNLTGPDRN